MKLYKPEFFQAEYELAHYINKSLQYKINPIVWQAEGLLHKQPEAVANSCVKPVSILTGPAGTGKTTTLKKIVDSFLAAGLSGSVISPTGKAAKRADEVINANKSFVDKVHCSTIHSKLEYNPVTGGFNYDRNNKFKDDFIVLDEFPMTELLLMRDVFEAIKDNSRIVLCGDQYQLPSIGPGNVARDLIAADVIPTVQLDKVLRTGENSGITYNANCVLRGMDLCKTDPVSGNDFKDFYFVPRPSESESLKTIVSWVTDKLPKKLNIDPVKDIQVISPGKNSEIGTKNLNEVLRESLNQNKQGSGKVHFRKGDKVINTSNNKKNKIVNGDVGYVEDIIYSVKGFSVIVNFGVGTGPQLNGLVEFTSENIDKLFLAYGLTCHKSQGSEFKVVIIPIHRCHTILLTRNMIYTSMTRGKQLTIMVGSIDALRYGIKNTIVNKRVTRLTEVLQGTCNSLAA